MKKNAKSLSIIVVTHNSEDDIYKCLDSIFLHNDLGEQLEVIVVDNASSGYDMLEKTIMQLYGDRVNVISNKQNGGYGQGNNIGIKAATAPYFLIVNPDVRMVLPIFSETISILKRKDVAMCGYKSMDSVDKRNMSFLYTYTTNPFKRVFCERRLLTDSYCQKDMFLSGACFAMNKSIFIDIGMFDENIFMYVEENDIHYRLSHKYPQLQIIYNSHLAYIHPTSHRSNRDREWRETFKSLIYFYCKNNLSLKALCWLMYLDTKLTVLKLWFKHNNAYKMQIKARIHRYEIFLQIFHEYSTQKN